MLVSQINPNDLTKEIIDRLLYKDIEDTGESADCILVLGSAKASMYRVPKAVEAYKAGRAGKIMLCGGVIREFPEGTSTEAEHMYKTALALGVSKEDILVENSSENTIENILFALIELQRSFWLNRISRVLLVTTAVHMRRSLAIAGVRLTSMASVICSGKASLSSGSRMASRWKAAASNARSISREKSSQPPSIRYK